MDNKLVLLSNKEAIGYCVSQFCYYWMVNDGKYHCSYKKPCIVKETFDATYNSAKLIDIDKLAEDILLSLRSCSMTNIGLLRSEIKQAIEEFIRE